MVTTSEYFKNVWDLLIELDGRSPLVHYVLRDTPDFPKEVMTGVDHLTVEGAESFTSQLVEAISVSVSEDSNATIGGSDRGENR